MNTDELQALHAELWHFRAEMADVWPTPGHEDSLDFAFTEMGEAMDAYLRTKGGFARNHERQPTVEEELADCAMMLLTAWPKLKFRGWGFLAPINVDIRTIRDYVAHIFTEWEGGRRINQEYWTVSALHAIAAYPGMDLPTELRKRMQRIRNKHKPATITIDEAWANAYHAQTGE